MTCRGATAVIGFIAEFYSFDLWVELLLVPLVTILTLLQVVAKSKPEFAPVEKLTGGMLALAGLGYVAYGVVQMIRQFQDFASLATPREFADPILLSLLFLPFIYTVSVFATYESNLVRLNWLMEDSRLRSYAQAARRLRVRRGP